MDEHNRMNLWKKGRKGWIERVTLVERDRSERSNFGGPRQQVSIRPGPGKINLQLRSKERL